MLNILRTIYSCFYDLCCWGFISNKEYLSKYSSFLLLNLHVKLDCQVSREGTCFRVAGVYLLAQKGLLQGMHLYS